MFIFFSIRFLLSVTFLRFIHIVIHTHTHTHTHTHRCTRGSAKDSPRCVCGKEKPKEGQLWAVADGRQTCGV